ncbi:MAG TPA: Hsp70 family protein, partial [Polyangia bacterium]
QFKTAHDIDLRKEKMALQRLKEAAERAKHELSSSLETEVNLPFIAATAAGPLHLQTRLTRGKLEGLVEDLIQKTLEPCKVAMRDAGIQSKEIDQIILVGGQTRMPRVQTVVEEFFGKKPNKRVDPDEVVAVGAAIQGGILKGAVQEVLLLDVTPLSLGVQTAGGVFTAIIPKNTTIPTRGEKMALQRLKEAAERAKHELSSSLETEVNLPFIAATAAGPLHLQARLTRGKLETLVEDLVQRSLDPCKVALKDAGLQPKDIDQVILVGGQTRMPRVQQLVEDFFGKKPNKRVDPDEVVAVGAAIQAGILKGAVQEVLLLDVTPLSLGVQTAGGVFTAIIPKNTTIPTRGQMTFSTAVDNQPFVEVHVLQGEREMAEDNKSLARFQLLGIPPAPRGVPQIQVSFDVDANGIVSVHAKALGTGKEQSVRVQPTSGLTEVEIARLIAEAEAQKDADVHKREVAELRLTLESLLYTSERAVAEYGHVLAQQDREAITAEIGAAKELMDGTPTPDELRMMQGRVESVAQKIGEAMYSQQSGGGDED